ncbi:respiratory nitrate reductase subunit gamma [Granulosicoccus sp. 3-233]|uniref:respiratory nitrate reductase subunit gamma n=1 Tax=Granulosicoccus sp. 3-233 TaxID=3417969 RepID=UPI003D348A10
MSDVLPSWLFSAAFLWLLLATSWRLLQWARTPSPLPIPLAPAPRTRLAVAGRLLLEFLLFRSLARANPTTWLASMAFHYGLLLVLMVHLRLLFEQLPLWLLPFIRISGWATLAMVIGLSVLLLRRFRVDRLRYISAPSDYLHLVLLLCIALSGAALKRLWPSDLHAVGVFLRGALTFNTEGLPVQAGLWLHLGLALLLILIFPISKLLHGAGVLFSPSFNQRDPRA